MGILQRSHYRFTLTLTLFNTASLLILVDWLAYFSHLNDPTTVAFLRFCRIFCALGVIHGHHLHNYQQSLVIFNAKKGFNLIKQVFFFFNFDVPYFLSSTPFCLLSATDSRALLLPGALSTILTRKRNSERVGLVCG